VFFLGVEVRASILYLVLLIFFLCYKLIVFLANAYKGLRNACMHFHCIFKSPQFFGYGPKTMVVDIIIMLSLFFEDGFTPLIKNC